MINAIAEEIVQDARWIPHRLDVEANRITFVRLEREDHQTVTFLEDQYFKGRFPFETIPIGDIATAAAKLGPRAPVHYLFHSSMAVSTLAARLFDRPGVAMALKEPIILNQVAALARRGRPVRPLLSLLARLFGRPFALGEAVVIKPGNVANILIPDLMAATPASRALILYSPLPDFLRSIAKKGMFGRIVYRRLYALLAREGWLASGFTDEEIFEQTDLQITAMAWLHHQAQFASLLGSLGERVRTIDSERFLADKRLTVAALFGFLNLDDDSDATADGPLFRQHSKELGRPFDAEQRRAEHETTQTAYGEEIRMVLDWATKVAAHCDVPLKLGSPLLA